MEVGVPLHRQLTPLPRTQFRVFVGTLNMGNAEAVPLSAWIPDAAVTGNTQSDIIAIGVQEST